MKGVRIPAAMYQPPIPVLWYPIDTATGVVANSTSAAGLVANNQVTGRSIATNAVLGVNAAGATLNPLGGLTHNATSAAFWNIAPTAGSTDYNLAYALLNLASYTAGETLLAGAEVILPAGYSTAHTTSNCVMSFGDMSTGKGGVSFEISSVERPQFAYWGQGATAIAAVLSTSGSDFFKDGERNAVVYEMVCTAVHTFKMRAHLVSQTGGYTVTAWTAATDLRDTANGGTAAPNMGTFGMRLARRNSATTNQSNQGETLRNFFFARFPSEMVTAPSRIAKELFAFPNELPRTIRLFDGDDTTYQGPDGNANKAFGAIQETDMFVYIDGATPFSATPELTLEVEPAATKLSALSANANYFNNATLEGTARIDTSVGGYKFGRFKTAANPTGEANVLLFSGYKHDTIHRGRCEASWTGTPTTMAKGVEYWCAWRTFLDFDEPTVGQLVLHQLYPGLSGSGMFPPFTIKMNTTAKRLEAEMRWADQTPSAPENMQYKEMEFEGYEGLRRRWADFCILIKLGSGPSDGAFVEIFLDGESKLRYDGPLGYRGPSSVTGKSLGEYPRIGIYPTSPYLTPDTPRDVYIKRFIVARNTSRYTVAQIRAALTA